MPKSNTQLTFDDLRVSNILRLNQGLCSKTDKNWIPAQWMNAAVGELGEAANFIKKVDRGDLTLDEARPLIGKELADLVMYIDILAAKLDIDLGETTVDKFNIVSDRIGSDVYL